MITTPATDRQVSYIAKLIQQRDITGVEKFVTVSETTTKAQASNIIDILVGLPHKTSKPPMSEGFYILGGTVYRVQKSKSSHNLYAKVLKLTVNGKGSWDYAPGAVKNLAEAEKLTLETAKTMGAHYGVCVVCGALLSDPESVERGIGPICASKL